MVLLLEYFFLGIFENCLFVFKVGNFFSPPFLSINFNRFSVLEELIQIFMANCFHNRSEVYSSYAIYINQKIWLGKFVIAGMRFCRGSAKNRGFGLETSGNFVEINPIFVQNEQKVADFTPKSPIFVLTILISELKNNSFQRQLLMCKFSFWFQMYANVCSYI